MPNIRGVAVAGNVRGPFEFGDIGMPCSDIARLQLLELLCCAEFVGLGWMLDGCFVDLEEMLGKQGGAGEQQDRSADLEAYHSCCEFGA